MTKSLSLFALALLIAGAATAATDAVQNSGRQHVVKTSRSAQCAAPSAKTSKECTEALSAQSSRLRSF